MKIQKWMAAPLLSAALLTGGVAHADSLKVFLEKYPKGEDAAALKYRYALYLEQFKQPAQAKKLYIQLLASSTAYKDSAFKAIQRLRKVQGTPESLPEKIAYARMACAKDEASACLVLLDSIAIINGSVGGVEVSIPVDMTALDPEMTKGKTMKLSDQQAEYFVRGRKALEDDYGFRPTIGIREGLGRFADWYKEYMK